MVGISGVLIAGLPHIIGGIPVWYEDADNDEYGNPEKSVLRLWKPQEYVANKKDCYDKNAEAKPHQTKYFREHRGDGLYDYNCDGRVEEESRNWGSCSNGTANQGWFQDRIPQCGVEGTWLSDCDRKISGTRRETENRYQKCR